MGREAKVKKDRKCKTCGKLLWGNAQDTADHVIFCSRLNKIGLIQPGMDLISDPLEGRKIVLP